MRDDAVLRRALPLGRGLGRCKEPETKVKWYFDSIEEIDIVYVRNRLRGTFACACYTLDAEAFILVSMIFL